MRLIQGSKEVVEMAEFIRNSLLVRINADFAALERARQRVISEENGEWFLQNQFNDPMGIGQHSL